MKNIKAFISVFICVFLVIFFFGCKDDRLPDYDDIDLRVSSFGAGEVNLFWTDPSANFDHLEITWSPEGTSAVDVTAGMEEYSITGLSADTRYTVTAVAFYTDGGRSSADTISILHLPESAVTVTSIRTAEELAGVNNDQTANYLLLKNIDLTNYLAENEWSPLGSSRDGFTGIFYGNGHVIKNLTIVRGTENSTNGIGLFRSVGSHTNADARVECLGLRNVNIEVSVKYDSETITTYGGAMIGGISGMNYGTISRCWVDGSIKGGNMVGGIAGNNYEAVIEKCWCDVSIGLSDYPSEFSPSFFGGLVGSDYYGTISNSYSFSEITVDGNTSTVGSFGNTNSATVTNCYAAGTISGVTHAGWASGFIGNNATCTGCFYDTTVSGYSDSDGGIPKTTAEMKDVATYTDTSTAGLDSAWDFVGNPNNDTGDEDIWSIDPGINNGYPYLTALPPVQ